MLERRAELGEGVRPESIPDRLSAQRHRLSLVEGDVDGAVIAAVDVQVALLADLLVDLLADLLADPLADVVGLRHGALPLQRMANRGRRELENAFITA
jgi:hypothetical protein